MSFKCEYVGELERELSLQRSLVRPVAGRLISAHVASHRRGGKARSLRNF